MKPFIPCAALLVLVADSAFGQGAQADQIKRRAKELNNQNNVRQGVPPPAPPATRPAPAPTTANPAPVTAQSQNIAKIKTDLAVFKSGSVATSEQKQQLTKDLAAACRTTKPQLSGVTKFVDSLAIALAATQLGASEQGRLAQDIEAVLNSKPLPAAQFDAIVTDVQAILQVGGAKRNVAVTAANDLKAIGLEVRK